MMLERAVGISDGNDEEAAGGEIEKIALCCSYNGAGKIDSA